MRLLQKLLIIVLPVMMLAGCEMLRGMNIEGVDLTPLADAGSKLGKATVQTSEQEEADIGRHMAGTLLGASQLEHNTAPQLYVNRVGRWLTLHSARPDLDWHFGVLDDNDINAFAAPGGYVFVTRGLLNLLDNEAELAGVLSHEIAHVTHQDYLKAIRNTNLMGAALDVGAFAGGAITNGQTGAPEAAEFGRKVANASRTLYARGLDKNDEYAADAEALRLMNSAGYDPYAFVVVMQKLDAHASSGQGMALLLQTHPSPANRLKALSTALDTINDNHLNATLESRFQRELAQHKQ